MDVFVFKHDYDWLSEKYDLQICEYDWNKHYIWAQIMMKLPISINLIFNIESELVENFEIDIEEFYGFCPHCSEPITSDSAEVCPNCGKPFY